MLFQAIITAILIARPRDPQVDLKPQVTADDEGAARAQLDTWLESAGYAVAKNETGDLVRYELMRINEETGAPHVDAPELPNSEALEVAASKVLDLTDKVAALEHANADAAKANEELTEKNATLRTYVANLNELLRLGEDETKDLKAKLEAAQRQISESVPNDGSTTPPVG